MVDGRRAEAALEELAALGGPARDVGPGELDHPRMARLEIDHACQGAHRKTLLPRIENGNGDDVMLPIQAVQRTLEGEVQKVGEDENDRAFHSHSLQVAHGLLDVGGAARTAHGRVDRRTHHHLRVGPSPTRGQERADVVREEQQPDPVGVLHRREREDGRELGGDVALAPVRRPERHRPGDVDGDEHGQIALLDELLHVRHAAARGHVPVDRPDVVARHVLANLRKLDPVAVKCRVIVAGESRANETRAHELQVAHAARDRGTEIGRLRLEEHQRRAVFTERELRSGSGR